MKFSSISLIALTVSMPLVLVSAAPNFIVMQPDDLEFLEAWTPPPHFNDDINTIDLPNTIKIPNIEKLRLDGLQMMQAHAASPMCGTSRYSTITGRYPSRSSYGRESDSRNDSRNVIIPRTKLIDEDTVLDGNDCSKSNLAAAFQANNYRTGVVGKWHLYSENDDDAAASDYVYTDMQDQIKMCGFDVAEAIYPENLNGEWTSQYEDVNHNMEHVASEAIEFIHDSINNHNQNFFLYLNPTVPHGSGNVRQALRGGDCRNTVEGQLSDAPIIRYGTPEGYETDCLTYRQTVLDRAETNDDKELGAIWIDDAIGWILKALEDLGELDNTFFLFQMDHGQEGKGSLYQTGTRIAQFIHYPAKFNPGTQFHGLVSTIDIGPTMLELAGIDSSSNGWYEMDGTSWANVIGDASLEQSWLDNHCLFFENGRERGVQCGCDRHIVLNGDTSETREVGIINGIATDDSTDLWLFDLCDAKTDNFLVAGDDNPEQYNIGLSDPTTLEYLNNLVNCHLDITNPSISGAPDYSFDCTAAAVNDNDENNNNDNDSSCQDVDVFQVFRQNGGMVDRDCLWVGDIARKEARCNQYGEEYCPVTCGLCG